MRKNILFVDDEPNVLQGLQRMLHSMRQEWSLTFVGGGAEALEALSKESFDVIVSDIRMPGMDGITLLNEVKNQHPNVMRIILSGQSKQEHILPSVGLAHQYLSKPSSCDEIKHTIARVSGLRDLLSNPTLQALVSKVGTLPTLPSIHAELVEELQSETCSVGKIGEIVSKDAAMTAKLLQLVNSSFFGLSHRVSNAMQAVQYLGIETVRALMLSYHAFAGFEKKVPPNFSLATVWRHSLSTALLAKHIAATETSDLHCCNDAWAAGLMHDIGKMILASSLPKQYTTAIQLSQGDGQPLHVVEKAVFGATHAEVGACLLALWGLPDPIVEAVAYHHKPELCVNHSFGALTAVYAANVIEHGDRALIDDETGADAYLASLGLSGRLRSWAASKLDPLQDRGMPEVA